MTPITPESLGRQAFRRNYGLRYAYLAGAMYKGIASARLVVAMAKAGLMGYFGAGGLTLAEIESALREIKEQLRNDQPFGMNLLSSPEHPEAEEAVVDLYLRHHVRYVEAAAFMQLSPSVVRYRLQGLVPGANGRVESRTRILAKVSRPEVATVFMSPAPEPIVHDLLKRGLVTETQAQLARRVPVATEVCVECDSGGHTDQGIAYALIPAMLRLRDELQKEYGYAEEIALGAAGGIGTPEAAAASFIMGVDFVLTGSINQCSVEAGTSDAVKDILQEMNVQDTAYAPAGDMFELGAKVQVARRGVFFPARANKLYELYQRHNSIEEIDPKTRQQIQEKYFKRSFEEVWAETRGYYRQAHPGKLLAAEQSAKQKMALIFKWYFVHSTRLAMNGTEQSRVDYQIHCGPAMGACNQWLKSTTLQDWRNRSAPDLARRIMRGAAELLGSRLQSLQTNASGSVLRTAEWSPAETH